MRTNILLPICILALLLGYAHGAAVDPADVEYRATVLVRDFAAPGVPVATGELAAEAVAATLEERGLARVVRPVYATSARWDQRLDDVKIDDVQEGRDGHWTTDTVDVYGLPERRRVKREKSAPASDFAVEGVVSQIGQTWWVKASIRRRTTRRTIETASAMAEGDAGLFKAARDVAGRLEAAYASGVLQRRALAILQKVELQVMPRQAAAARLEEVHARWPLALEPAAARLLLAAGEEKSNPETVVSWAMKVVERLRLAEPEEQRFLLRLGLDPYDLLAAQHEAQGKLDKALAVHLEAVQVYPGSRQTHWQEVARLEAALGRDVGAIDACRAALELNPDDPGVHLQLGLLLEKTDRLADAARHLRLFLQHAPDSPRADAIRVKIQSLAPAILDKP